jgi:hypothetical protein
MQINILVVIILIEFKLWKHILFIFSSLCLSNLTLLEIFKKLDKITKTLRPNKIAVFNTIQIYQSTKHSQLNKIKKLNN